MTKADRHVYLSRSIAVENKCRPIDLSTTSDVRGCPHPAARSLASRHYIRDSYPS